MKGIRWNIRRKLRSLHVEYIGEHPTAWLIGGLCILAAIVGIVAGRFYIDASHKPVHTSVVKKASPVAVKKTSATQCVPTKSGNTQITCTPLSTSLPNYAGPAEEDSVAPPVTMTGPAPSYTPPVYSIDMTEQCVNGNQGFPIGSQRNGLCISPVTAMATGGNSGSYTFVVTYHLTDNGRSASCSDPNFNPQDFSISTSSGSISPETGSTGGNANDDCNQAQFSVPDETTVSALAYSNLTWQVTSN